MRSLLIIFLVFANSTLSAQCYMDRHNTSWNEAWVSCQTQMSPNPERGSGHWIQYDLGFTYILGELHVWNINDPEHLDRGASQVAIDLSIDGENWTEFGTYMMAQGTGSSLYEGEDLLDFDAAEAHYILITVQENYGGACSGISEIRAEVDGIITDVNESVSPDACFNLTIFPNPHDERFFTKVSSTCYEVITVSVHDVQGRLVESRLVYPQDQAEQLLELGSGIMESGVYILTVQQGDAIGRYQVVKGN